MYKNRIGSAFFLVFSLFYFWHSFNIALLPGSEYDPITARTFPFYIGILGIVVSCLMLLISFIKVDESDRLDIEKLKKYHFDKGVYFVLAMSFYALTIRVLGFSLSTAIFLMVGFLILKERRLGIVLGVSFGVGIVFWVLLSQVLGIYIEQGIVFELLGVNQ